MPKSQTSTASRLRAALIAIAALCAALLVAGPASAASVNSTLSKLQGAGSIDTTRASMARGAYSQARSLNKHLSGTSRTAMTFQIRTAEALARTNRLTADRVLPLFSQLQVNVNWFKTRGPAVNGTRSTFGSSKIIYQYFAGYGWEFHPLANFSRMNAVWTDKSAAARRSLSKQAYELISFGVNRGGALTWEYYFPFSGSRSPFISSISQGTALQALARAGNALKDPNITAAGAQAVKAFDVATPVGLKVPMDGGNYYAGYSGTPRVVIFNMFAQALDGLHDYGVITGDSTGTDLYEKGLITARIEEPKSDTGAWSYYQLGGAESNLNYHEVLVQFLSRLCEDTDNEALFCNLETKLAGYLKARPVVSNISKKTKSGRLFVTFTLDKVSTVTVKGPGGSAVATVPRGKHVFSVKKGRGTAVTITAKDLAGNTASFTG